MTDVPIEDYDNIEATMNKMCKCGHKLSYHGFTDNYDQYSHGHYFHVSQCVFCDCQKFEEVKKE